MVCVSSLNVCRFMHAVWHVFAAPSAALRRGDVVVAVDDVPTPTVETFRSALLSRRVEIPRRLRVLRDDTAFTSTLRPTTHDQQRLPDHAMRLTDVDAATAAALGLPVGGVAVTGASGGALGARLGDRIEGIGGDPVTTVAAAHRALERCGRWCIVDVRRDNVAIRVIWDARPGQSSER